MMHEFKSHTRTYHCCIDISYDKQDPARRKERQRLATPEIGLNTEKPHFIMFPSRIDHGITNDDYQDLL